MIENKLNFPAAKELRMGGYAAEIVRYTIEDQLLDEGLWRLFVDQFRRHTDGVNGWKGEFWGKMMRGGAITYRATGNAKLYRVLTDSVKDLLNTQDKQGRISSYPKESELCGWDMWSRKYVMLGLLYYLDVCKSEALKKRIVRALKRHADYIVARVGEGKNKKSILKTAEAWGALNSCSILEPIVKLYALTGEKRYFDFSTYIVSTSCCADFNLIEACLTKELYPFEFRHVKAYEMMSCLEGVLEYYKCTGERKYLTAVENFVDMVEKTDYTIIGCSGCTHELFDNSTEKQTEPTDEVMQETCVTVTFMKLCAKLLALTGEAKYAAYIERSGYNALLGAVNNERQIMAAPAWTKEEGKPTEALLPFDSYSPLFMSRRGRRIGGYQVLDEDKVYGCCAAIGSAGTGIFAIFGVMECAEGYNVNLYNDMTYQGNGVKIAIRANVFGKGGAKLKITGGNRQFTLRLRVPAWAENFIVALNGEKISAAEKDGYLGINRVWRNDEIKISYTIPVVIHLKNGKIAFTRGPIVLCRDERLDDITKPVNIAVKDGKRVRAKLVKNGVFKSNLLVKISTRTGEIALCDYAQAGKNFTNGHGLVTVWQEVRI